MTQRAEIYATNICDGMGKTDEEGSYLRIVVDLKYESQKIFRISKGGAENLEAELHGLLESDNSQPCHHDQATNTIDHIRRDLQFMLDLLDGKTGSTAERLRKQINVSLESIK